MIRHDEIVDALSRISDPTQMSRFLSEVLTDAERRDLGLRWKLMQLLHGGVPQREVAAQLGISLCKITRGSRVLKRRGSVCRSVIEGMKREGQA
ncbi:MAG: transcriptional regulator [Lentisphaerae bacterium]|nr:transcriptional regulator [Lentisphaerota bacterium]